MGRYYLCGSLGDVENEDLTAAFVDPRNINLKYYDNPAGFVEPDDITGVCCDPFKVFDRSKPNFAYIRNDSAGSGFPGSGRAGSKVGHQGIDLWPYPWAVDNNAELVWCCRYPGFIAAAGNAGGETGNYMIIYI